MTSIVNKAYYKPFLLVILSLFFYIGLGHVHLFDWDEINFAESAREMIVSGDYMKVQIDFKPFWEKPPLFFWLQVLSMKIFGINEFAARLPNALIGSLYLLTLYFLGKKHRSESFGLLWALVFFGSLLPHLYFKSGIIDPVFNFFIFLSVFHLYQAVENEDKSYLLTFWAGIFSGLSFLTKGPVGLLIVLLVVGSYVILNRFQYFPKIKQIINFVLGFLGIVSLWLSVEFWQNGVDNMLKFIQYQIELFTHPVATHGQPFYYHFVVVFLGCFPISILALPRLFSRSNAYENLRLWMQILFWTVMILFSITTTKIVHYSSMSYLPLSYLAADYLYNLKTKKEIRFRYVSLLLLFFGALWAILFVALPVLINNPQLLLPYLGDPFAKQALLSGPHVSSWSFIAVLFWIVGLTMSFIYFKKDKVLQGVLSMSIGLALTLLSIQLLVLPKIEAMTQGTHISFLKSVQNEDVYISSYGFKSYAPYFYGRVGPTKHPKALDMRWLIEGEIDKPVYLIANKPDTELSRNSAFKMVKANGGFYIYRREK